MAKQINTSVGGVVKTIKDIRVGVGGAVKTVIKGVGSVGGVIKEFYNPSNYDQIQNYYLIYDRGTEYVGLKYQAENTSYGGFITKNSDHYYIGRKAQTNMLWSGGLISTSSTVDLTGWNTASFLFNSKTNSYEDIDTAGNQEAGSFVTSYSGMSNGVWSYEILAWSDLVVIGGQATFSDVSSINTSKYIKYTVRGEHGTVYNHYLTGIALSKSDDIATLASKAGISNATISNILNNSSTLLNNYDAVQWMIKRCTGDFMIRAVSNANFKSALNNSPFKSYVTGNTHWAKFLAMTA